MLAVNNFSVSAPFTYYSITYLDLPTSLGCHHEQQTVEVAHCCLCLVQLPMSLSHPRDVLASAMKDCFVYTRTN